MKKLFFTLFAFAVLAVGAKAQEVNEWPAETAEDTIAVAPTDTIVDSLAAFRHPCPVPLGLPGLRKAVQASACPVDSVITTDRNGVVSGQKYYEYDAAGNTVAEKVYTWKDGVRTGVSKYKKIFTGSTATTTVNYKWDATLGAWIGKDSTQLLYYSDGKQSAAETYVWENGAWRIDTKYEYEYSGSKQTLSLYSVWSTTAKALTYSNKWVWQYIDRSTDEAYWVYSGGQWTGSSRTYKDYDAAGNQIVDEQYSGWQNNTWKGKSKYTAQYDDKKHEIEHITYKWVTSTGAWSENVKVTKQYEGENVIDNASYVWSNGWIGNTRTSSTYEGALVANEIKWAWDATNGVWVYDKQTATTYTNSKIKTLTNSVWNGSVWVNMSQLENTYQSDRLIETNTYAWHNDDWTDSLRTTHGFNAKGIDTLAVSAAWNSTAWIPIDSTARTVSYVTVAGKSYTAEDVTMTWTATTKAWKGTSRKTNEYDDWGNVKQADTYTWLNGTGWINNVRRLYAYKDGNPKLETLNSYQTWNNTKKVWSGTSKTEKGYDETNRLVKTSTYKWNASHNNNQGDWEGLTSNEDIYENNIKVTSYSYKWDATLWNWIGMFRHDYTYSGSKVVDQIDWRYDVNTGWYYDARTKKQFDGKGREIQSETFQWVASDNKWCSRSLSQTNYDADAAGGRLRSKVTVTGSACVETAYAQESYFYECDEHMFTIRFENYDGALLESTNIPLGQTPTYSGARPTKEATAEYTYSFKGWSPEVVAVIADATYTAQYDSIVNTYTITFQNYDSTSLQSGELAYGAQPEYTGDTPAKPSNAQYTYSFKGWDAELVAVTAAATYTAQFDSVVNTYVIAFENYDGTSLQSGEVAYGTTPKYTGDTPNKPSNAQYTYSFKGWDAELVAVTAAATYTAQFDSVVNTYVIAFENYDGTSLQSGEVAYGTTPKYTGDTPNKLSTPEYTYTFTGWSPEVVAVTEAATYTAQYDSTKNSYLITWLYDDGSEISHATLEYGATPTPADATKPATAQYSFVFKGWNTEVVPVTGEATYTAVYDSIVNQYTVVFYFEDGVTEIERVVLAYGETPSTSYVPSIPGDKQYTYVFVGWSPEIAPVTGDASYTAVFKAVPRQYTIVFKNYNGAELLRTQVDYGTIPVYTGDTPAKKADTRYTYQFNGWTPELTEVTGDATYTAVFKSVLQQYTIVFRNYDGTELQTSLVDYGTMPVYTGETPVKEEDEQYTYSFSGWTPALKQVSGNATYTAKYTSKPKSHEGLNDVEAASQATKVMIDGRIYILRAGHLYTLSGSLVE